MKKILKSMIATILCAVIAVTSFGTEAAYAADKTPIKVTFKKKTVTLYATDDGLTSPKLSTLKKKWGKPKTYTDEYGTVYKWTKGKSDICYTKHLANADPSYVSVHAEDKNVSVCGIKVGMKKTKAAKILKKYGGKDDGYGNILAEIRSDRVKVYCGYEKDKVTNIQVTAYIAP